MTPPVVASASDAPDASSDRTPQPSERRSFLSRMLAASATLGLGAWARPAQAADARVALTVADDEPWMKRLHGTQRVVFHSHLPTDGLALTWARTFLETHKSAYGRQDSDCSVVVGLNGRSIGLLFNDAMWAQYPIAETMGMKGTTNPNGPSGSNLVSQLIGRGALLLVCQNSLRTAGSRFLPEPARSDAAARAAFSAAASGSLLPGVEIVPAMIVTLQMAQDRGCRYVYAGS